MHVLLRSMFGNQVHQKITYVPPAQYLPIHGIIPFLTLHKEHILHWKFDTELFDLLIQLVLYYFENRFGDRVDDLFVAMLNDSYRKVVDYLLYLGCRAEVAGQMLFAALFTYENESIIRAG